MLPNANPNLLVLIILFQIFFLSIFKIFFSFPSDGVSEKIKTKGEKRKKKKKNYEQC